MVDARTDSVEKNPELAGVSRALNDGAGDNSTVGAVLLDMRHAQEQQDILPSSEDVDTEDLLKDDIDAPADEDIDTPADEGGIDRDVLIETIHANSKGVKDSTDVTYHRLMKTCDNFLIRKKLIKSGESLFSDKPSKDAPYHIVAFIMHKYEALSYLKF
ncbi:hypothetical protein BDZ89DRAFT_1131325 [Hymenopellis radicata]|nr:hypothetical protein BDZ89DRAFT_1131325 [Hymenopellis radicata]